MPSTGRESGRAHCWPKKIKSSAPSLIQSLLIIMFSPFYVRKINKRNTIFYILGGFCTKNSCQANKVNKWITTPLILLWAVCAAQRQRTFSHSWSGPETVACQVVEKVCGVYILQTI